MPSLPLLTNNWSTRLLNQHFGVGLDLDDIVPPVTHPPGISRVLFKNPSGHYHRIWRSTAAGNDSGSTITPTKDKFQMDLDVQQFAPEEITVKVTGKNIITVEGRHEEKQDKHGFVSRHFVRKYVLPDGYDIDNVVSSLSSDGVLTITAPRVEENKEEHRTVPIQQTGVPLQPVRNTAECLTIKQIRRLHF